MGPHQGRAEGKENLPRPAGHTLLHALQDPIGLLGNQGTLLAHGQLVVHQDTLLSLPNLLRNFLGLFGYKKPQFPHYCNKQWKFAKQEIFEGYGIVQMPTNPKCARPGKGKM